MASTALQKHVFDVMNQDADAASLVPRITKVRAITQRILFETLPAQVQTRVVAKALTEPPTTDAANPAVPKRFRDALETLRDRNREMSRIAAWKLARYSTGFPAGVKLQDIVLEVGPTRGTGSVKQVFAVKTAKTLTRRWPFCEKASRRR